MPSRRSLLSCIVASAALNGGLFAANRARSAITQFVGTDGWLNTNHSLTIAGLRGKVQLVQFCTYTCINWRRTLSYMKRWHSEYRPQRLQIIGVHTPEFGFERIRPNVEKVMLELDIRYPIARDNEYQTWQAWENRAWPSFYLLDGDGQGSSCSRRGRILPGDRASHSQSSRPGEHRFAARSSGRCRSVSHWHTRDLFRISASHATGQRAVAPAGRGNLRLRTSQRSQVEPVSAQWDLGARGGSTRPALNSGQCSRALLSGEAILDRWFAATSDRAS